MGRLEHHLTIEETDQSCLEKLALISGLSQQRIKMAMQKGAVWLTRGRQTQRLRRVKRVLRKGDEIHLYYDEAILATEPTPPDLIADHDAYSVWYKPYGLRSQGSKWGDHCTVHRWVEQNLVPQRPAFVVHRLDRAATGLMLIAHQKRMATALAKLFESRQIEKRYRVIVHGQFSKRSEPVTLDQEIDGRSARSVATFVDYNTDNDWSLVEVLIETGRKHQIRRHLAEIDFPVVGDRLYGRDGDREDLKLVACFLRFVCPVIGGDVIFQLPKKWEPKL